MQRCCTRTCALAVFGVGRDQVLLDLGLVLGDSEFYFSASVGGLVRSGRLRELEQG